MPRLPEHFLNSLSEIPHLDLSAFAKVHEEENRITSIRLNPYKKLISDFDLSQPVPWCSGAFYLSQRPSFTLDPSFHSGAYYVQEAGSMFLEQALKQHIDFSKNLNVLDLCAAPGGKSTLISSLLNQQSLLVSNEVNRSRADLLAYQLSKWGQSNTIVTNNDAARFSKTPGYFDVLVVDAPCSGSGLFRKQPEAINEWSISSVQACSLRQKDILNDALPALKQGGYIFYSTCSYSSQENEHIVQWLMLEHDLEFIPVKTHTDWGIMSSDFGYRFYPHLAQSEGFFCALLRKKEGSENKTHSRNKKNQQNNLKQNLQPFLNEGEFMLRSINDRIHAISESVQEFLNNYDREFYFRKAGTLLGEVKGRDFVPDHELALSSDLVHKLNRVDVDLENALQFMRKQAIDVGSGEKGFAQVCYKGLGLGWIKILDRRSNNYLPPHAKILM